MYRHRTGHEADVTNICTLLAFVLYSRRFFMYYTMPILVGIDRNGIPHVYGYDSIGSFKEKQYDACGSARELMIPVLDTILRGNNLKD